MSKPTKKSFGSLTSRNFNQKCHVLAVPRIPYIPRSTSVPGTPSTTSSLFSCRNPSLTRSPSVPRSPSGLRSPSVPRNLSGLRSLLVPRTQSIPQTPPVPRVPYVPHSIRESNSYGPRIKKYDDYINIFDVSDDSDKDLSNRKKDQNHEKPAKGNKPTTKYEPESIHRKGPTKTPSKPILHCYNTETKSKNIMSSPLTTKKSAPIKKISFVLPGCKKPPDSEHMDWKDFHKLNVIYQFMDDLERNFPSICTTTTIGKSVEGRDLKILKISNSNASNVAVWIDSGIHAREWIAPAVNTYIANHIIRNFDNLPESVRNKDWYFLPIANPDGYHYSHSRDRMWRKNRALYNGIRSGVDLNRNFCLGWGRRGSSDKPHNAFYRGPHPFSEPESSAMRDMLLKSGINFEVYITLHCYGQIIIFPYSFTSEMAPDYVRLLEGATTMSKAIYNTNGSTYKVGVSKDVMYSASGTSNDFAHGRAGIPYCYLIELRSKKYKFNLPKEQIEETGKEILNSVLALVEYIDTYPYQDRVEQNIDSLLENDSFLKNSFTDRSDRKKLSDYKKSKYSYPKKIDPSNDIQGSFIRLTHYPGERDDSGEETSDTECSNSLENVNESFLKNKHRLTSKKQIKQSDLENNYTSTENMDPYKKIYGYLPDSIENGNESVRKKKYTSEKETNPYMDNNEYLPDSFNIGNESVLKKIYTSEKETNPYKKVNECLPDSFHNGNEPVLKKIYTSEKETNPFKRVNEYLPNSFNNGNESVLKKKCTSEKGTNSSIEVNEYLPDSVDNGNESVLKKNTFEKERNPCMEVNEYLPDFFYNGNEPILKKIYTSEKETNPYKKVNQCLDGFFDDEKEYHRNKTNTLEKGTYPYLEENQYYPDSIDTRNESDLLRDDVSYGTKQETVPSKKLDQYVPDDLKMDYPSEKEINEVKKNSQHLSDSFNSEKELKKIKASRVKKESFKKVIQYLPDSFDGEKESNLNKINASEKETNTSEKDSNSNDSDDSLLFRSDSFINKAEPIKVASDASICCVDPKLSETDYFIVKDDSFEAWNIFYEQKSNFDRMRSSLLLKTDNTFDSSDIQWYLYFDMF